MGSQKKNNFVSLETATVRVALIEEGWSFCTAATRCGLTTQAFADAMCYNFPHRLTRYKMEAALGYKRPIWSDAGTLSAREGCVRKFGFDPYIVGMRELRSRAGQVGADFSTCTNKMAMIREVFARAAITKDTANRS
jgi:hypothetical protein